MGQQLPEIFSLDPKLPSHVPPFVEFLRRENSMKILLFAEDPQKTYYRMNCYQYLTKEFSGNFREFIEVALLTLSSASSIKGEGRRELKNFFREFLGLFWTHSDQSGWVWDLLFLELEEVSCLFPFNWH